MAYGDMILKGKNKVSVFVPMKSFMVRGKEVGCNSDIALIMYSTGI